ncbi:Rpn family recombination-promoting nuclease/putative transposase [Ottowia caeni]|uniref:Rpn family recombination-promoting nuclease/putative transposase n=1 Tax=Ottowia caeni TaxID=2870339 RepID=UPI001E502142|nr:Rpn family recombination-promoting nuclease/putative transposase [Ottowia caeni]
MSATPHDGIYKQIFSHPQTIEALLRGFIHEDWVDHVDLSTLEKTNGQYVSEDLQQRSEDVVWRVKLNLPEGRQEWLYLYLLIEFQSKVDRWMAVRLLSYVSLLYQDLIKSGQVKRQKLPPVFPIVIYNGEAKWWASLEVADLIAAPKSLARFAPRFRHHVLDEGRVPRQELASMADNVLAYLFMLETSAPDSAAAKEATSGLARYFSRTGAAYDSLRRAFLVFYQRNVFSKLSPGETIEEIKDFQEVEAMYATRFDKWSNELLRKGEQKGKQEGKAEALFCLLTRRFGPLGEVMSERVRTASSAELEQWLGNILDARTLDDVFCSH